MANDSNHEICPHCGADLRGTAIPEEFRQAGHYGPPATAPTHYSRKIGVEIRGVYDGSLYYRCPDCDGTWHRWPVGHHLHDRASLYMPVPPKL